MQGALVDSCIVNDLCLPESDWYQWSADTLAALDEQTALLVNPIIFSECSVAMPTLEATEQLFESLAFDMREIPRDALFLAGKAFLQYRRRGGLRTGVLPDFLIGAHAAVEGMGLVTRDRAGFISYFPTLQLITPS